MVSHDLQDESEWRASANNGRAEALSELMTFRMSKLERASDDDSTTLS